MPGKIFYKKIPGIRGKSQISKEKGFGKEKKDPYIVGR